MKKLLLIVLGLLLAGALALSLFRDELVARALMYKAVPILSGAQFDALPDGLHVMLCGAGSPLPDPKRSGPCTLLIAGQHAFVFDIGSGATGNITPMGVPMSKIEALFLTHFHSDHIDGLGELMLQRWAGGGHDQPLPIFGPTGVESVVAGFNQAYQLDFGYRVAHHGPDILIPTGAGGLAQPFVPPVGSDGLLVWDKDGVKITAFAVNHAPIDPAVGYRIDYAGRSVVISGDTSKSATVQHYAQGVDLLVHEGLAPHLVALMRSAAVAAHAPRMVQIFDDILNYHTSPIEAAEIAQAAGVGHLLFTHIVPALPIKPMEKMFLSGVDEVYSGPVTLGRDGTWISLPRIATGGSKSIDVGQRL